MAQRYITGFILLGVLALLMYLGGTAMSIATMICICLGVYEEYHVLKYAGHKVVSLPLWIGVAVSIPLAILFGAEVLFGVAFAICLGTMICIMLREDPQLTDILFSLVPMFFILLPGMCIIGLAQIPNNALRITYLCTLFAVPVACDTFAMLIGSRIGGPKLCPAISPNKTVAGAIGGMIGSLVGVLLVGTIAFFSCDEASRALLPAWWEYMLLGLVGGVAAQVGDLIASLVKRFCGVKDFSNLFPGHGGMMDRMDSVLFMALTMYCFYLLH